MRNTVLRQTLEHDVCWIWRFMLLGKWATDGYGGLHLPLAYQSQKARSIRLGLRTCIGWGTMQPVQICFWNNYNFGFISWQHVDGYFIPLTEYLPVGNFVAPNPHGDERNLRPFTSHSPPVFKCLNFPHIFPWLNHHNWPILGGFIILQVGKTLVNLAGKSPIPAAIETSVWPTNFTSHATSSRPVQTTIWTYPSTSKEEITPLLLCFQWKCRKM